MDRNETIAKWCGFKQLPKSREGWHYENGVKVMNWMPPDQKEWYFSLTYLPDFHNDFNVCIKFAVPELNKRGFTFIIDNESLLYTVVLSSEHHLSTTSDKSLPMAFCMALEKLIKQESR